MVVRSRRTRALVVSLAAALALSGLAALAESAHAASGPASLAGLATQVRRNVTYVIPPRYPRTFNIDSRSVDAPSPDEFQIAYADANLTLSYRRMMGGPITNQYTLALRGLVEWNDTMGNGEMQDGTIVGYTPLGSEAFGRYPVQHGQTTTAEGITVYDFVLVSNQGEVTLNLTIADGFVALSPDSTLTPMEAKLSLDVRHNMTLPGTHLAVQLGLSTDQNLSLEDRSWDDLNDFSRDERALNMSNPTRDSSAFFAWSNTASVNGVTGPVTPFGPVRNETSGDYDFTLSYPVATYPVSGGANLQAHVVHDPALGVVSVAYASILHPGPGAPLPFVGDAVLYGVSLVGIAALVGATAILVSRRRRRGP